MKNYSVRKYDKEYEQIHFYMQDNYSWSFNQLSKYQIL